MVEVIVESTDLAGPDGVVPLLLAPMPMARARLLAPAVRSAAFRSAMCAQHSKSGAIAQQMRIGVQPWSLETEMTLLITWSSVECFARTLISLGFKNVFGIFRLGLHALAQLNCVFHVEKLACALVCLLPHAATRRW